MLSIVTPLVSTVIGHSIRWRLTSLDFGMWYPIHGLELSQYHADREQYWQTYLETPPEYFGQPSAGFADLGWLIASDSRFPNCATEQMASALLQQSFDYADAVALLPHREAFLSSGLRMKALVSSIVQSDAYRAGKWNDAATAQNKKMLSMDQLVSSMEDLTGFRWTYGDFDMFGNDIVGLRSLAGGVDGRSAGKEATVPNATILLVQNLLAEQAASYRIQLELAQDASDRKMFTIADLMLDIDADSDSLFSAAEQVQRLYRIILTREVTLEGPEVASILNLWREVYLLTTDPIESWTVVLTALLRDPTFCCIEEEKMMNRRQFLTSALGLTGASMLTSRAGLASMAENSEQIYLCICSGWLGSLREFCTRIYQCICINGMGCWG